MISQIVVRRMDTVDRGNFFLDRSLSIVCSSAGGIFLRIGLESSR